MGEEDTTIVDQENMNSGACGGVKPKKITRQQAASIDDLNLEIGMNDSSFKTRINLIKSNKLSGSVVKKMLSDFEKTNDEFRLLAKQKHKLLLVTGADENSVSSHVTESELELIRRCSLMTEMERTIEQNVEKGVPIRDLMELPKLNIPTFSDNNDGPLTFYYFKLGFENALKIIGKVTDSQKFLILKNHLNGKALGLVQGIVTEHDAFTSAWRLLGETFFKPREVLDILIKELINLKSANNMTECGKLLTELRFKINELKGLGCRLLDEDGTNEIADVLIRDKFPKNFLLEIIRITGEEFPSVSQIMSSGDRVVLMHANSSYANKVSGSSVPDKRVNSVPQTSKEYSKKQYQSKNGVNQMAERSFTSDKIRMKNCKFCNDIEHFSSDCQKYKSYGQRKDRCSQLKLCKFCLGKHDSDSCFGRQRGFKYNCGKCNSSKHTTPMCDNFL